MWKLIVLLYLVHTLKVSLINIFVPSLSYLCWSFLKNMVIIAAGQQQKKKINDKGDKGQLFYKDIQNVGTVVA